MVSIYRKIVKLTGKYRKHHDVYIDAIWINNSSDVISIIYCLAGNEYSNRFLITTFNFKQDAHSLRTDLTGSRFQLTHVHFYHTISIDVRSELLWNYSRFSVEFVSSYQSRNLSWYTYASSDHSSTSVRIAFGRPQYQFLLSELQTHLVHHPSKVMFRL